MERALSLFAPCVGMSCTETVHRLNIKIQRLDWLLKREGKKEMKELMVEHESRVNRNLMLETIRTTNYSKMNLNRILDPYRDGLAERVVVIGMTCRSLSRCELWSCL